MITSRTGNVERKTKETQISLSLNLDGTGNTMLKIQLDFLTTC